MAQVASHFKCKICNEVLNFPSNIGIVDFTISFLQFYKEHDRCEQMHLKLKEEINKEALPRDIQSQLEEKN